MAGLVPCHHRRLEGVFDTPHLEIRFVSLESRIDSDCKEDSLDAEVKGMLTIGSRRVAHQKCEDSPCIIMNLTSIQVHKPSSLGWKSYPDWVKAVFQTGRLWRFNLG